MLLRRTMALLLVALALAPSLLLATPLTASAQAAEDEQTFQSYLSALDGVAPVAGPIDGTLDLSSDGENAVALGVNLSDFAVHVDFAVPVVQDNEVWAAAVAFRQSAGVFHYFVVWSDGTWSFAPANGGPVASGTGVTVGAPGELIHLYIFAVADKAYVGQGNAYLTTLDLTTLLDPGDITVTANLIGQATAGETIAFEALAAWDLEGAAIEATATSAGPTAQHTPTVAPTTQAPAATVAPTETASETPAPAATTGAVTTQPDDSAIFASYLADSLSKPILFGPETGTLTHQPDAVSFYPTNITAANFIARVECIAGQSSAEGFWDCGFVFRGAAGDHFRVAYVSDGYWFFSQGAAQPIQSGTDGPTSPSADSKVVINLIADGNTGYFGINDEYIATLDLSTIPDAGNVDLASAFFADTYIEGGGVGFEDLIIWSLDEGGVVAPTPTTGVVSQPSPTVSAALTPSPEPTTATALQGVTGNSYTSPTFGYSLTWPATWTVSNSNASPTLEVLELGNGVIQADLIGEAWDAAGGSCFDRLTQFYQSEPGYSDVQAAVDNVSVVPGIWETTGILTMTYTDETGVATTYVNYAACSPIPNQAAIVSLEQFVPIADFASQVAAMDELRAGFAMTGGVVVPAATATAGTTVEPTPTTSTTIVEPTPTTGVAVETPTSTAGQVGNVVGNTYTSPTFGYSLTWDDSWSVIADQSEEGIDFLRISSGTLVADLYAAASSNTPLDCIDELFNYYSNDELYSNVTYATGPDGQPLLQDFGTYATGVISYTQLLDSGETIDQFSEAICYRMDDPGAVVIMEIYMAPSDYVLQRSAISALQAGLVIPGQPGVQTTEVPQTPVGQPTAEASGTEVAPPPEVGAQTATFLLQPLNGSGVTGTGTLEAQARLVIVTAIVIGAQPGDTVTIQRGSCSTLTPGAEPDYIVGELDDSGLMREEMRVRLAALTSGEPYAVVVYAGGEDFSQATACGDIS